MRRLLYRLLDGGHECHVAGYVVEEARRNLIVKAPAREAAYRPCSGG